MANEPTCILSIGGATTGHVRSFHEWPGGVLLVGAAKGLFRYDGKALISVEGLKDPFGYSTMTGYVTAFHDRPSGLLLLGTQNGLFLYDGKAIVRVEEGEKTGYVLALHDGPGGLLVDAMFGLFRYDGKAIVRVEGREKTGSVRAFHDGSDGLLLGAQNGLFHYDGKAIARVSGDETGSVEAFHDGPDGLLLGAQNGLFRYDGTDVVRASGEETGSVRAFHDGPGGLLLGAQNGLFHYDGKDIVRVKGEEIGDVETLHDGPGGLLVVASKGLFRYDGTDVVRVKREKRTGYVEAFHDVPGGLLLGASNGLFFYDGKGVVLIKEKEEKVHFRDGPYYAFHDGLGGLLLGAEYALFRVILEPISSSQIDLNNWSELRGASLNRLGVPTRWTMTHPCSAFADRFGLHVVATNAAGKDGIPVEVKYVGHAGGNASFEVLVPISEPGEWTFRVVSMAGGTETNIGKPSGAITFVAPVTAGFLGWLANWWRVIAANSVALWAMLNLLVFAAARYSAAAWRLATDELWGKKALFLQSFLLRHWRRAQLWLLDLYVRERRKTATRKSLPFLPLPLTGPDGKIADSDAVLARLSGARHLWVQGGTGMGKTAMFLHLRQTHFAGTENTAFAIFQRDGYVLVPIEARRFPEAAFDEKGASAWVVACVLSVLSEGGLSFEDRGLLRAMLSKGTLAIAIDGLNEVARGQAVTAFAAEFPAAPLLVTSQELGEPPFEVWRLPGTIAEHVDGLLTLYLGAQRGEALARRLRDTGLIQHLRSGYDVRLVIDLAEADPEGAKLPHGRLELYRAAIAAAWPEGDERLELLQAAAWKLLSERGPNEDKRRLKPDVDAPKDLLEQLEAVRERSGRSIRLIRGAPPYYEFVHDQMNAYLAACWFSDRPTDAIMKDLLEGTKVWQDGLEAQRTLWGFVAAMLDRSGLEALWIFAGDDDRRAVLGRALAARAEREGWTLTRPPAKAHAAAAAGQHAQQPIDVS
ncbi:MAG TPA: hypothetical protein VIH87_07785 [Methylocella sp.]